MREHRHAERPREAIDELLRGLDCAWVVIRDEKIDPMAKVQVVELELALHVKLGLGLGSLYMRHLHGCQRRLGAQLFGVMISDLRDRLLTLAPKVQVGEVLQAGAKAQLCVLLGVGLHNLLCDELERG